MGLFKINYSEEGNLHKSVKIWLLIGVFMLLMQILIGGITRLTGSGLSITKWEIITGSIPPLNEADWVEEFAKYQQTPQYVKINQGMSLSDFKFIYFWEYLHRLWARWMGLVFLVPFAVFLSKGMLSKGLVRRLGRVVLLAALAASFGWIMVASGLINRPWVNAYKLTLHLSIGFSVLAYLLWTTFHVHFTNIPFIHNPMLKKWALIMSIVAVVQFMLGGVMSGMKAGLFYPTWPLMNGEYLPGLLLSSKEWNVDNLVNYDRNPFMSSLIQFLHRNVAYLLTIIVLYFSYIYNKMSLGRVFRVSNYMLVTMLVIQITLGVLTLINCKAKIPVVLGEMHQIGGVLLLSSILFIDYLLFRGKPSS